LAHGEITIITEKTGRVQIIPIAPPLFRYMTEEMPTQDDSSAPLFPRAYDNVQRLGRVGSLSRQFHKLLASAGLVPPEQPRPKNGNKAISLKRRTVHPLSFHSLRHTMTSVLKNLGVNAATVMDIVGHQSTAVSTNYTHIDSESKRRAITLMPDISSL
jgi:integrase